MEKDKWDTMEEKLDRLEVDMLKVETRIRNIGKRKTEKVLERVKSVGGKKNHPLHFLVEKDLIDGLRLEAKEKRISMGELCRRKLRGDSQLDRIERKIDGLKHN
ncbi:hypothetical protein HNV12_01735 [Methanococcoides sp. SA1]|nr:hypothetical protein [Methanococcoides sp. SA1]